MNRPKEIQSILWKAIEPSLLAAGFDLCKNHSATRFFEERADIIELRMARPGKNAPYRMPPTNCEIEAGVYFKIALHPMGATLSYDGGDPVIDVASCHFRASSSPHVLLRDSLMSSFWRVDPWNVKKDLIIRNVIKNVEMYMIPWFEKFDDLNAVRMQTLKVTQSNGRDQDRAKNANSWGCVYGFKTLLPFLDLRLKNWSEAQSRFTALLDEPHYGHDQYPDRFPEKQYENIADKLRDGLAIAEAHL